MFSIVCTIYHATYKLPFVKTNSNSFVINVMHHILYTIKLNLITHNNVYVL
jgi:hypothetical protein